MQRRGAFGILSLALCAGLLLPACEEPFSPTDAGVDSGVDVGVTVGDKDTLLLVGTVVTPDQVLAPGEVLTYQDAIVCVAASCAHDARAAKATRIRTGGIIFPGLIDAHNHTQYNYLPRWKHSKVYGNHNQWQAASEYKSFTQPHQDLESSLLCEMIKFGELRALIAGTTTIQGTPLRKCANTLIRNADLPYHGFSGGDTMRTNVIGVSTLDTSQAQQLQGEFKSGSTRSYVIHLAEGIDETARKEFDSLESLGLLLPEVVVIHGTALGQTELGKLKQARMPLVWSPSSNLDLYGKTNDIVAAQKLGLLIALAPDWTPTGTPNVLEELRAAQTLNQTKLGQVFTAKDLVQMVTSRAAAAIKYEAEIGALKTGLRADLLVVTGDATKPYDALVAAKLGQVRLVVVRGKPLYGDPVLMQKLAPTSYCETITVCGTPKVICVKETETSPDKLDQSLGQITTALTQAYTAGIMPLVTCP